MKLTSIYGFTPHNRKFKPWDGWPLPECRIGLEWEFENGLLLRNNVAKDKNNAYFTIHDDGSLRDNGVELVTSGDGLFGEDLLGALEQMDKYIKQNSPTFNYRTGFHVHLDIRDLEEKEVHNLLILYCLLEKPIFNFAGADRWKSNFCVPWFRSDAQFPSLKQIETLEEKSKAQVSFVIKGLQRYSALNCQSIAKFGTLEFRHLQNTNEVLTKQKDFITLVMLLKRFAMDKYQQGYSGQRFFEYCKSLSPYELIREFGFNLVTNDWDYPEALMQAVELVNFKEPSHTKDFFFDAVFDKFIGKHPNFR